MEKVMAKFFYEQCVGSTSGHMAMVPNNPMLFTLAKAYSMSNDSHHAATEAEFSAMLLEIVDALKT